MRPSSAGWTAVIALVAGAACTTVLGIDEDYTPVEDAGTGGTTATGTGTASSTGGATTASGGAGGATGGLALGSPCEDDEECDSSHCVDGVCCDEVCNDDCLSCSAAQNGATDGTCSAIPAYDDPDDECKNGEACDGAGACKLVDGEDCDSGNECISGDCNDEECAR